MALLVISKGAYQNTDAPEVLINYIMNANKMSGAVYGGQGVSPYNPAASMYAVKQVFSHTTGKQMMRFTISFNLYELIDMNTQHIQRFAYEVCSFFPGNQILFGMHDKNLANDEISKNPHIHFAVNTTDLYSGKKNRIDFNNIDAFKAHILNLLIKYDIGDELITCFKEAI